MFKLISCRQNIRALLRLISLLGSLSALGLSHSGWQRAVLDSAAIVPELCSELVVTNYFKQRDLAKRPPSWPYISGDTFRALAEHVFDETVHQLDFNQVDASLIQTGDLVFVKTDYLKRFFTQLHPRISATYILITHNSDGANPGHYEQYLADPKLGYWFGCNPSLSCPHPKFTGIPIGLANAYHGEHGDYHALTAQRVQLAQATKVKRPYFLGLNFAVATNLAERRWVHQLFNRRAYCKVFMDAQNRGKKKYATYLRDMARTQLVISPHGAGLDCHRTWEALLLGSVPVVQTSTLDPLYENLPVMIVPRWERTKRRWLEAELERQQAQTYQLQKLFFPYWANLIWRVQRQLRERAC